ncbi:MAG: VOC family protein [Pseudomonadota bacterium]
MKMHPYLTLGGHCAKALDYYRQHLGATEVQMVPFAGSPAAAMAPPEWQDKILHASCRIGAQVLMASDGMPNTPFDGVKGCSLSIETDSEADTERIFAALCDGGSVGMALAPTFFARRFGTCTDKFGVGWMVIYGAP